MHQHASWQRYQRILLPQWPCIQRRDWDLHILVGALELLLDHIVVDVGAGSLREEVLSHRHLPLEIVANCVLHSNVFP